MHRLSHRLTLILAASFLNATAQAGVFNLADGDVAALIDAINTSNNNGEVDTIHLATDGDYVLPAVVFGSSATGLPRIEGTLTIHGSGATVRRSTVDGTLFADGFESG